ncbi:MAG: hypothetical protein AB7O73_05120 [Bacteroidia bacterium]
MNSSITDKEALDIAWKYFQQHAQQRYTYLNYFVVFSAFLTTGLVTTFQPDFRAHYIGIGLSIMQIFVAIIFWKIDQRNKFLTKHSENAIKEFESKYTFSADYSDAIKIFSTEDSLSKIHNLSKKFPFKQITHGSSFKIIFVVFFTIGVAGTTISIVAQLTNKERKSDEKLDITIKKMDSLKVALNIVNFNLNQRRIAERDK